MWYNLGSDFSVSACDLREGDVDDWAFGCDGGQLV